MIPLGVLASAHVPSAGSAWTPANLPGLFAWFDASDTDTIMSSGGLVSQWGDKSTNGYHVTSSGAYQPSTGTRTLNTMNVLDFTRSGTPVSSWMKRLGLTLPSPFTVATVAKFDALFSDGAAVVGYGSAKYAVSAFSNPKWRISGTSIVEGGTPSTTAPFVSTSVMNGASSLLRVNGSQVLAGNAGTTTGDSILISAYSPASTSAGYGIDGLIAEIVIATGALTGPDLTSLESYLMTKWGIA